MQRKKQNYAKHLQKKGGGFDEEFKVLLSFQHLKKY